jgi:hypothetical protein
MFGIGIDIVLGDKMYTMVVLFGDWLSGPWFFDIACGSILVVVLVRSVGIMVNAAVS